MLFSDPKIQALLRDELVPCWQSVHETAKVEITFADGKKLERTLGGNTVIYVCTAQGRVVDAFPGVYTPDDFLAEAGPALAAVRGGVEPSPQTWQQLHGGAPSERAGLPGLTPNGAGMAALLNTISKGVVESPPRLAMPIVLPPNATTDLSKYAMSSRDVVQLTVPEAANASPADIGQRVVAFDSAQNRRLVRPQVHALLARTGIGCVPVLLQHEIFEGILHVSLSDPYFGYGDVLVPGTAGIGR